MNERLFFETVLNTVAAAVLVLDPEGRIQRFNHACEQLTGYSEQEVQGKSLFDLFILPEEQMRIKMVLADLSFGRQPDKIVNFWRTRSGENRLLAWSNSVQRDSAGNVECIIATGIDITDQHLAQQSLQEAEARYRTLVEQLPAAVYIARLDTLSTTSFINRQICELTGHPAESFLSNPRLWFELLHPDDRSRVLSAVMNTQTTGEPMQLQYRMLHAKGEYRWIRDHAHLILDPSGMPVYLQGVMLDVTKAVASEQALLVKEAALQYSPTAIAMADADGLLTYVNQAFLHLWGFSPGSQILGRPISDFYCSVEPSKRPLGELLRDQDWWQGEMPARKVDGTTIDIHTKARILRGADNTFLCMLASFEDITKRKHMQWQIKKLAAHYQTIFETVGTATIIVDEKGIIQLVNSQFERLYGYSRAETEGQLSWEHLLLSDSQSAMLQNHRLCLQNADAAPRSFSVRGMDSRNRIRELAVSISLIPGTSSVIASLTDVTDFQRLHRTLRTLSICTGAIIKSSDAEDLLRTVCQNIVEIGGYVLAWVGMATSSAEKTIIPVASAGVARDYLNDLRLSWDNSRWGRSPAGTTIRSGRTTLCRNIARDPDFSPWRDSALLHGLNSIIALPLLGESDTLPFGVLSVCSTEDVFDAHEVALLEDLAQSLAYGFTALQTREQRDQAQLQVEQSLIRLEELFDQTVATLALTFEARDPYTAGHQKRVAVLSAEIGRELRLEAAQIRSLWLAGSLHDIGKITVPGEILSKPGAVSAIEMDLIRSHSQTGANILRTIDFPWPVAEIVLQHHERIDGSGYPQQLVDSEIRLEAKILAVADVTEAMASHRPYRPARGIHAAIEELTHNQGILYDGRVVEACLQVLANHPHILGS